MANFPFFFQNVKKIFYTKLRKNWMYDVLLIRPEPSGFELNTQLNNISHNVIDDLAKQIRPEIQNGGSLVKMSKKCSVRSGRQFDLLILSSQAY